MAKKLVPISSITKFGNAVARSIRSRLKWSKQLRGDVKLLKGTDNGGVVSITIEVGGTKKDKSGNSLVGMARAYEYGSGEHATRGVASKYTILPRNKRALWFPYPANKIYPGAVQYEGGITVKAVRHPGVEARPFISPALRDVLPRATEELKLDIKKNIIENLSIAIREMK